MKWTERSACQVLGLGAPTTLKEARSAYRALAQELHPDKGGDEERFKQVSSAYQYLVDYYENAPSQDQSRRAKAQATGATKPKTKQSSGAAKPKAKQASQKQSASSTGDHRDAWRAWRDQVDEHKKREAERDQTKARQDGQSQKQANPRSRRSSSSHEQAQPEEPTSTTQGTEVVEATVVLSWGDQIREWSEAAGEKLSTVRDELQTKLARWYRHSNRGLFERGRDEKLKLIIDQETLLHGKQQRIAIQRAVPCPACQIVNGALRVEEGAAAALWAEDCSQCGGEGRVSRREELSVYVPPGADHGHKLKVTERGSAGLNGQSDGDLFLLLTPEALPRGFTRRGAELELQQGVSADLLRRGGVLPIQTLRGIVNIKVPPDFRSGKRLLIPEQGLPMWGERGRNGDLTVTLRAI